MHKYICRKIATKQNKKTRNCFKKDGRDHKMFNYLIITVTYFLRADEYILLL